MNNIPLNLGGPLGLPGGVIRPLLIALLIFILPGWYWFGWRIEVPPEHLCVLIHKTGENLPPDDVIATDLKFKGIQLETLKEGRWFRNPLLWDWRVIPQVNIPQGNAGVLVRLFGSDSPESDLLAVDDKMKGVVPDALRPGRYPDINPLAFRVMTVPAVQIRPGHVGVVTLRLGRDPVKKNTFLVADGERGVQEHTLAPGTYYINPYEKEIQEISLRSHRFDMAGDHAIRFPSKDSFNITLEGTIEWFIDEKRVAEIFMKYNDEGKMDFIDKIVEKVIIPNARAYSRIQGSKHLGKEFISGATRTIFQEEFLADLIKSCQEEGVVIKSALVKTITPPDKIASVIRDREIAKREQDKYEKEKETQVSAKNLAMEELMVDRQERVTNSQQDVSVAIKNAEKNAEVKVIAAEQQRDVAHRELEAAKNQAEAIKSRADAEAQVIRLDNNAEAAALQEAVDAFGGGAGYARYEFLKKIAPGMRRILDNTNGVFADFFGDFRRTN